MTTFGEGLIYNASQDRVTIDMAYVRANFNAIPPSNPPATTTTPVSFKVEAESYSAFNKPGRGVYKDAGNGGFIIGDNQTGDTLSYTVNVPAAGTYKLSFKVASGSGTPKIGFTIGGNAKQVLTIPVNGWNTYTDVVSAPVTLASGNVSLVVSVEAQYFNFDAISFDGTTSTASSGSTTTPTPTPSSTPTSGNKPKLYHMLRFPQMPTALPFERFWQYLQPGQMYAGGGWSTSLLPEATIRQNVRDTPPADAQAFLDIEHFDVTDTNFATIVEACRIVKSERPTLKLGLYDTIPYTNYWLRQNQGQIDGWMSATKRRGDLIRPYLDFVMPDIYIFYNDRPAYVQFVKDMIKAARLVGLPVVPFMMPVYHPGTDDPAMRNQLIPGDYWRLMLETVYPLLDQPGDGMMFWMWEEQRTWAQMTPAGGWYDQTLDFFRSKGYSL